ncbi:carboxylate-amine ligase [Ktedonospora formicarum]|uniref:Putative glutamate--cysteine ligase 2 n=1 Tax=Ktedonospora formicarum TaxID=2778364 RepID=A0A8J3MUC2_9CHLR|nr:carboxylate-amine ligase [Ktedonospora formicarum]GHO45260.1 putative glutamate--cysteine ligase 2 [Ktedonospora formicarum]
MPTRFTLGIEEEFQLVDDRTGELRSCAPTILEKGYAQFGELIKPEVLQTTLELTSPVFTDIGSARRALGVSRARLAKLVASEGLALMSAGTHPYSSWQDQESSKGERYDELIEEYRDLVLSDQIFGLHVHIGIGESARERNLGIKVLNQVRTWLPHLLALSTNAPFWEGRYTGLKSYRAIQWKRFPRSGVPDVMASWDEFERYVRSLVDLGAIDNGKKVWWDVRPHTFFSTLEFRVCDMPSTLEDTLAIAALCQALVVKLAWLNARGREMPTWQGRYIDENKWRATRYGLNAEWLDFQREQSISMRDAIAEMLDFVEDVAEDLGSQREMEYIRDLLGNRHGTGADRQIAAYKESGGDLRCVLSLLREQTMRDISLDAVL